MKHGTKIALALMTAALSTAALAQPKTTFSIANTATWGAKNYNPFTPAASHLRPCRMRDHGGPHDGEPVLGGRVAAGPGLPTRDRAGPDAPARRPHPARERE